MIEAMAREIRPRRWRPAWLTRRMVSLSVVFTAMIFIVVLGVASVFAKPPSVIGTQPAGGSPTPSPVQHDPGGEPND